MANDNIKRLLDKFCTLEQSAENTRRKNVWNGIAKSGRDQFRATPKSDRSWKDGQVPLIVDVQNPTWSKILDFDMNKYYFDADVFTENYLKMMIYRFENFADDTFLTKDIPMWGSSVLEGSLFGLKYGTFRDKDPWLDHHSVITNEQDLANAPTIDFRTSGIMPILINAFEGTQELFGTGFNILFPEWIRSPFGVAMYVHGFENVLVDMMVEEEFYHKLMRYITDSRKTWYTGLEKYLGYKLEKGNMYNDEVNCPTLSPELYRDKIYSYEQELCEFHGGLHYWHSCGDVGDLSKEISKLTDLDLFNVGPWTSVIKAGEAFANKCPIEICMNPQKDILEGTAESMTERVTTALRDCVATNVAGMNFKVSALNAYNNEVDRALSQVKMYVDVVRTVANNPKTWL